jgi:hypothetical protein
MDSGDMSGGVGSGRWFGSDLFIIGVSRQLFNIVQIAFASRHGLHLDKTIA